jgi:protein-disulfide isomerase
MRTREWRRRATAAIAVAAITLPTTTGHLSAQSQARPRTQPETQAQPQTQAQPRRTDPLAGRTKGSARAPVTVYEMSDFQCPYCRRFALETFPAIEKEYIATGKVRWIFINFPLTSIHPNAVPAAELALCAAQQGAFWPVHDLLYEHQEHWAPLKEAEPFLLGLADSAKMNHEKTLACLQSPATRSAVQADAEGAARSGAQSTPAFYIEGSLLTGAHRLGLFRRVLDSIYATKKPKP